MSTPVLASPWPTTEGDARSASSTEDLFAPGRQRSDLGAVVIAVVVASLVASTAPGRLVVVIALLAAAIRLSARQMLTLVLLLSVLLESPGDRAFLEYWSWPLQHLGAVWFGSVANSTAVPLPLSPLVMVSVVLLARCSWSRIAAECRRMAIVHRPTPSVVAASAGAIGACGLWTAYGLGRGGEVSMAVLTIEPLCLTAVLVLVAQCLVDRAWSATALRVVLVVAVVRAVLCIVIWAAVIRRVPEETLFVTTHADSLVWAVALIAVFTMYLERHGRVAWWWAGLVAPVMAAALVLNTRRLSFVVLVVGGGYVFLSSRWRARRRLARAMPVVVPILGLYAALGLLTPPSPFFAPVQSLQSVADGQDSSSQTREVENYNLIRSMQDVGALGSGFGVAYHEYERGGDISQIFREYRFVPHNQVLGLLLFGGPVGFAAVMLPMSLATRRAHRARRSAEGLEGTDVRVVGAVAVAAVLAWAVQGWGDLGFTDEHVLVLAAVLAGGAAAMVAEREEPAESGGAR